MKETKLFPIYKNGKKICCQSGFSEEEALKQYISFWVSNGYYIDIKDYTVGDGLILTA